MIEFKQPHFMGGVAIVRLTVEQAIAHQKQVAWESKGFQYASDDRALADFCDLHFAYAVA